MLLCYWLAGLFYCSVIGRRNSRTDSATLPDGVEALESFAALLLAGWYFIALRLVGETAGQTAPPCLTVWRPWRALLLCYWLAGIFYCSVIGRRNGRTDSATLLDGVEALESFAALLLDGGFNLLLCDW